MKIQKFCLLIAGLVLFESCQKQTAVAPTQSDVIKNETATSTTRPVQSNTFNSGSTAALTLQANGSYTATWGGAELVFTGISVPTSGYKFGDGITGYNVTCTNGYIVSSGGSYFVGNMTVMSQADLNIITQNVNQYKLKLSDFQKAILNADNSFKQSTLPNFYNEVMVGSSTFSNLFSGGVIYDPGVTSHLSVTTSAFVATIPTAGAVSFYLGELIKNNIRYEIYATNLGSSGRVTRIEAYNTSNVQLDTYSVSGLFQAQPDGGYLITGSVIVGNSNNTPISINDEVYGM